MYADYPHSTAFDVMFRSYLEDALHASESKLHNIVENSVDGFVLVDAEGYIVLWSLGQERITGISAGEALGKSAWEMIWTLTPAHQQDQASYGRLQERMVHALASEDGTIASPSVEFEIQRPDGELRVVQQFTFALSLTDERRIGCVFRDVTDLRRTTQRLVRRNAELNLLNRINRVLASTLEPEQLQKTVLREVVRLLNVTEASMWLVDETSHDLVCVECVSGTGEPAVNAAMRWQALAEQVVRTGHTLASQAGADPAELALPAFGPDAMPSFVGVPMRFRNSVVGVLLLIEEEMIQFSESDIHLLESVAASVAAAFENALLYRKSQELAVVQERQRLAVNLHDAINQSLFSAGLIAEVLPRLIERDSEQAAAAVNDLRTLVRGAVADLREVLAELQPALVEHVEFGELLRQLAAGYTGRTGTTVTVTIGCSAAFPPSVQEALYRGCREIFRNIAKHADATQVAVEMDCQDNGVLICICDNGCGFDADQVPAGHFGLAMLRQQTAKIGAELHIRSMIGAGSEFRILVPNSVF